MGPGHTGSHEPLTWDSLALTKHSNQFLIIIYYRYFKKNIPNSKILMKEID